MSTVGWAVPGIIPRGGRDMDRMLEKITADLFKWVGVIGYGGGATFLYYSQMFVVFCGFEV